MKTVNDIYLFIIFKLLNSNQNFYLIFRKNVYPLENLKNRFPEPLKAVDALAKDFKVNIMIHYQPKPNAQAAILQKSKTNYEHTCNFAGV